MANYNGEMAATYQSERYYGTMFYSDVYTKRFTTWKFSTEQVHSGSYSLKLNPGCCYDIDYGCNAGEVTITVWVYPKSGASACLAVINPDTGEVITSDTSSASGAWEQLSVNFTAEKKVYIVRLLNKSKHGDHAVYFDDLS